MANQIPHGRSGAETIARGVSADYAEERGTSRDAASAAEKQIATLDTRQAKVAADPAALVADWRETANGAGFGPDARLAMVRDAQALVASKDHRATIDMQGDRIAARAVAHAADKLSERQSVFSVAALQGEAGRIGLGKVGYAQIGAAIGTATKQGELIDRTFLDRSGAEFAGFTTRASIETETKMLRAEAEGRGTLSPIASPLPVAEEKRLYVSLPARPSFGRRNSLRYTRTMISGIDHDPAYGIFSFPCQHSIARCQTSWSISLRFSCPDSRRQSFGRTRTFGENRATESRG